MKEAAGEANMTVITIVLIAIVLGVGTVLVNSMLSNTSTQADCTNKGNIWYNGSCYTPDKCSTDTNHKMTCGGNKK